VFASALAVLAAASPTVDAQVVDRAGRVVGPRTVAVAALRVRADGRTCRLRAGLPVGVLRALKQPFRAEGSCSSLYISEVRRQRERGAGGWVYKVGRKLPGVSASAPSARLRSGQQVTWFWCKQAGACQRTLETQSATSGDSLRITVRSYDDRGPRRRVSGRPGLRRPGRRDHRRDHRRRRHRHDDGRGRAALRGAGHPPRPDPLLPEQVAAR
jgi:hypothetical protein